MSESTITKKALAAGLKSLMKAKSFDKISVADIAESCGLNRQTFYYHFQDKFDLVNWIYNHELICFLPESLTYENWDSRLCEILEIMEKDRGFYQATLKSSGNDSFQKYLYEITRRLLMEIIPKIAGSGVRHMESLSFIAEFFSFGIVGIVVQWAQRGMKESPREISRSLRALIEESKQFAAERYLQESQDAAPV